MQLKKQIVALQTSPIPPISPITPTPPADPTTNWKTYTNTKYGYYLKYPSELTVGNGRDPESAFVKVNNLFLTDSRGTSVDFFHDVNPNKLSLNDWLNSDKGDMYNNHSSYTELKLNEKTFYLVNPPLRFSLDNAAFQWVLLNNTDVYLIGNHTNLSDKTVELILSTFKFLDQTTTPQATYTCPPTGYVDCMPILDEAKKIACSPEAMSWYKANCPNFKGGAL